ncbi:3058_t:CDS:10 [Gigaspora margarita]|uniref:3058_t:CDS:1 n=1 Tax=Gigaspora margarita TaxID=4874 RepID=A0ABN7VL26_GIGMA|nr:3058_t:CDS:10 [Gigaspora margarita]
MQRIENHYNELKNQLRNLQNAKKELAKSQPYKVQRLTSIFHYFRLLLDAERKISASEKIADNLWKGIRNTEYMSCCIRGWAKDFLEQGTLPSHQQGKHAKRASLLDDEDLKLAACTWLRSIPPKDRSPLALKKELETNIFPKSLGVSITISDTRKFMEQWGFHKKTIGQQWVFRLGRSSGHSGKNVQEYRKKWAIRMMNYRKKMEQYNGDEMENVIPPERLKIWDMRHVLVTHNEVYFYANDDNSSFWIEDKESIIKKKGQGSAIMARIIIKLEQQANGYWKSEDIVKQLCEKAIPIFNALHPGCIGIVQIHENDGIVKFKGIKKILEDRNMWTGQRLDCQRKKDNKKVPNCCARHTLIMEPDFVEQKTSIAETVEAAGHIFELYPKFHCECNFIERFLGCCKTNHPSTIRKAWRYIEAYAASLEGEDAERALEIKTIELNQQPSDDNKINNPLIAKTKGAPKKRKTFDIEKQVSKKSKSINKQEQITTNKENKQENSLKTLYLGCNVSLINQLKKQKESITILQGITKGYSTEINFNILTSRVSKLFPLLTDIINKKISSFYYDQARQIINNMDQVKASIPMIMMNQFHEILPGYYGAKGLSIIAEYLQEHFIIKKILTKYCSSSQIPNQYLYNILLPETASRLIFED